MKILVMCHGTRGDVQPFLALSLALSSAGHEVSLATLPGYENYTRNSIINHITYGFSLDDIISEPEALKVSNARNPILHGIRQRNHLRGLRKRFSDSMDEVRNCDVDIVVYNRVAPGYAIAKDLQVPAISTCLAPGLAPTKGTPHPLVPFKIPKSLNYASYHITNSILDTLYSSRSASTLTSTVFQAFSKYVLPTDTDYPPGVHTTGFWFLPSKFDAAPSQRLIDFVSNGSPPIYIGFGSNLLPDPHKNGEILTSAIRRVGVRAVIVGGYGGIEIGHSDTSILHVDEAPFSWLFPRVSAIFHHGGSGTTALALAAGRPQVILPINYHQKFYAQRMRSLGVAPKPLAMKDINSGEISRAISNALRLSSSNLIADLSEKVRKENGIQNAIRIIESRR